MFKAIQEIHQWVVRIKDKSMNLYTNNKGVDDKMSYFTNSGSPRFEPIYDGWGA